MALNAKQVTEASFEAEVLKSSIPVLVDFWAEWCGPCRALAPKLEEIAAEMANQASVCKLDVDTNPNLASQFGIRSIPTLILFKNGQAVEQVMGNQSKENLVTLIKKHL